MCHCFSARNRSEEACPLLLNPPSDREARLHVVKEFSRSDVERNRLLLSLGAIMGLHAGRMECVQQVHDAHRIDATEPHAERCDCCGVECRHPRAGSSADRLPQRHLATREVAVQNES